MKSQIIILIFFILLFKVSSVPANTLSDVVKEARKQGQVLSAKTRQGMHEVRVVTPQGSVKTIRKSASQTRQSQQADVNSRPNYSRQRSQNSKQQSNSRRELQHSRQPEFRRFIRPSQSVQSPQATQPSHSSRSSLNQQTPQQTRKTPSKRRIEKRDPD